MRYKKAIIVMIFQNETMARPQLCSFSRKAISCFANQDTLVLLNWNEYLELRRAPQFYVFCSRPFSYELPSPETNLQRLTYYMDYPQSSL